MSEFIGGRASYRKLAIAGHFPGNRCFSKKEVQLLLLTKYIFVSKMQSTIVSLLARHIFNSDFYISQSWGLTVYCSNAAPIRLCLCFAPPGGTGCPLGPVPWPIHLLFLPGALVPHHDMFFLNSVSGPIICFSPWTCGLAEIMANRG